MKAKAEVSPVIAEQEVRVVKPASCPSLSGKSTLSYEVGIQPGEADVTKAIRLRLTGNSKAGMFSSVWISFAGILAEFAKVPKGETVTAFSLQPLYEGKSINSPSFLFAVLKAEGIVSVSAKDKRRYDRLDHAGFVAQVQALSGKAPKAVAPPPTGKGTAGTDRVEAAKSAAPAPTTGGDQPSGAEGGTVAPATKPSEPAANARIDNSTANAAGPGTPTQAGPQSASGETSIEVPVFTTKVAAKKNAKVSSGKASPKGKR